MKLQVNQRRSDKNEAIASLPADCGEAALLALDAGLRLPFSDWHATPTLVERLESLCMLEELSITHNNLRFTR